MQLLYLLVFSLVLMFGEKEIGYTETFNKFDSESFKTYQDSIFPASWEGIWVGTLEIFSGMEKTMAIPMELHILPIESTSNYTWKIIYGEDKEKGLRDYELHPVDPTLGHYAIDEKNSIVIDNYFIANKLINVFEVMGSMIIVTIEMVGDTLHYEIIAGKSEPVSITGDSIIGENEIPAVKTYPIGNAQIAILSKLK